MNNNEKPAISVIVPVYKVEDYLSECVNSILSQTYNNFELILVDDGSPDNCGQICEEFKEKDNRVHVIHKENGGLSDARNKGIEQANGEYITFIDSDDFIYSDYLTVLYEATQKYGADIAQGLITTDPGKLGSFGKDRRNNEYNVRILSEEEAIKDYLTYRTLYSNSTFKLIKRELFSKIQFPVGKYSEDEYTTYRLILRSKKIVCIPIFIYYYRLHEGSIVHSYNEKRFEVCDELPDLIKREVMEIGYECNSEIDYKNMRIQLKIYNDFIQGGQYSQFKSKLNEIENRIKNIALDKTIWDRKYILIRYALTYFPWAYREMVFRFRKS